MPRHRRRRLRWSSRARVVVLVVAVCNVAVLALLGAQVAHSKGPLRVDEAVWRALGSPRLSHLIAAHPMARYLAPPSYERLTEFGSPAAVVAISAALLAWTGWWRDARGAALSFVGPVAAALMTEGVLKPLIDRRDFFATLVFPSGHVTGAASVATVAVVLMARYHGVRLAVPAALVAAGLPVVTGLGAVGHHWHYFTDAVGGVATGVAVVLLLAALLFGGGSAVERGA